MGVRIVGDVPAGHLERAVPHELGEDGLVSLVLRLCGAIIVAQGVGRQRGNARPSA